MGAQGDEEDVQPKRQKEQRGSPAQDDKQRKVQCPAQAEGRTARHRVAGEGRRDVQPKRQEGAARLTGAGRHSLEQCPA